MNNERIAGGSLIADPRLPTAKIRDWHQPSNEECAQNIDYRHDCTCKPTSWLWPDRVIGKRESRQLREEHNALVNLHSESQAALRQVSTILNQPWKDCSGPKTLQIAKSDCAMARGIIERALS